jgi:hypothetical protein
MQGTFSRAGPLGRAAPFPPRHSSVSSASQPWPSASERHGKPARTTAPYGQRGRTHHHARSPSSPPSSCAAPHLPLCSTPPLPLPLPAPSLLRSRRRRSPSKALAPAARRPDRRPRLAPAGRRVPTAPVAHCGTAAPINTEHWCCTPAGVALTGAQSPVSHDIIPGCRSNGLTGKKSFENKTVVARYSSSRAEFGSLFVISRRFYVLDKKELLRRGVQEDDRS